MKQLITLAMSLAIASGFAQDGAPATYYNGFNWTLTGMPLKTALATKITSTHTNTLTYNEAENAIKTIDLDPVDVTNTNVLLLYGFSEALCPAGSATDKDHRRRNKNSDGGGNSCEWNREHTYAKSLGTPDLGTSGPGADAHHLRAADVDRNGDRGSEKFAAGTGNSHDVTSSTWYPGDEWKGDVARMMMYMYLRYPTRCLPKNVGVGTVLAIDTNMINLFLEWNAEDPVSEYEDLRNTYLGNTSNTYGQGNRNPFIDNPYLATMIWGGTPAENRWPSVFLSTDSFALANVSIYPNPSNGLVTITSEMGLDEIQLININGQVIRHIQDPTAISNQYVLDNLPKGFYLLRLASENQSLVKKIIVN